METIILILLFLIIPLFYYRVLKEENWSKIKKILIPKFQGYKKEFIGSIKLFMFLVIGFLLISFTIMSIETISNTKISDMENVEEFVVTGINQNLYYFIFLLIIIVFVEEFFFRAFLIKKIGILFSTILFTIFHLGYESIIQTIGVFLLGLILAYWFKKNNSLIQNYFGHLLYNILAIILYMI